MSFEWILIYLFVMIERIGSMLSFGWLAFWIGCFLVFVSVCVTGAQFEHTSTKFKERWNDEQRLPHFMRKPAKWLITCGFIVGILGFLLPSQKDAAIIIGSGVTYQALTSETGKRLGGKAVELLEQKIDQALDNTAIPDKLVPKKQQNEQSVPERSHST